MSRLARAISVVIALTLAGCGGAAQLAANPLGPCGDDAKTPGGFVELEQLLPRTLGAGGRAPDRVDSGRSCSDVALGTLKGHGVTELRFAGATWNGSSSSEGTVIAVLATPSWVPALDQAWVEEFYEAGARAGKKTDNVETSRPTLGTVGPVFWLDTINDLSLQSVVTWQDDGVTHVVIVATDVAPLKDRVTHNATVSEAVHAAAGLPVPSVPGCGCTRGPTSPG